MILSNERGEKVITAKAKKNFLHNTFRLSFILLGLKMIKLNLVETSQEEFLFFLALVFIMYFSFT